MAATAPKLNPLASPLAKHHSLRSLRQGKGLDLTLLKKSKGLSRPLLNSKQEGIAFGRSMIASVAYGREGNNLFNLKSFNELKKDQTKIKIFKNSSFDSSFNSVQSLNTNLSHPLPTASQGEATRSLAYNAKAREATLLLPSLAQQSSNPPSPLFKKEKADTFSPSLRSKAATPNSYFNSNAIPSSERTLQLLLRQGQKVNNNKKGVPPLVHLSCEAVPLSLPLLPLPDALQRPERRVVLARENRVLRSVILRAIRTIRLNRDEWKLIRYINLMEKKIKSSPLFGSPLLNFKKGKAVACAGATTAKQSTISKCNTFSLPSYIPKGVKEGGNSNPAEGNLPPTLESKQHSLLQKGKAPKRISEISPLLKQGMVAPSDLEKSFYIKQNNKIFSYNNIISKNILLRNMKYNFLKSTLSSILKKKIRRISEILEDKPIKNYVLYSYLNFCIFSNPHLNIPCFAAQANLYSHPCAANANYFLLKKSKKGQQKQSCLWLSSPRLDKGDSFVQNEVVVPWDNAKQGTNGEVPIPSALIASPALNGKGLEVAAQGAGSGSGAGLPLLPLHCKQGFELPPLGRQSAGGTKLSLNKKKVACFAFGGRKFGSFINYNKIIGYKFNSTFNQAYPFKADTYKLLFYLFKSMYCLISKPVLKYTNDKVTIQLFYYLNIPKKKVFRLFSISYINSIKKKWLAQIEKKKTNFIYPSSNAAKHPPALNGKGTLSHSEDPLFLAPTLTLPLLDASQRPEGSSNYPRESLGPKGEGVVPRDNAKEKGRTILPRGNTKIYIRWKLRKAISRFKNKIIPCLRLSSNAKHLPFDPSNLNGEGTAVSKKGQNLFFKLRKFNLAKVYQNKFKLICAILSNKFNKPVELQLIRLHHPYHDSNILVNLLSLNIKNKRKKARVAIQKIYNKKPVKNLNDHNLKKSALPMDESKDLRVQTHLRQARGTNYLTPAFLSGLNIKIAGRLMGEPIIPRITTKVFGKGASATGKVNYLDVARITKKNRKGAYTIKITSGQNFF